MRVVASAREMGVGLVEGRAELVEGRMRDLGDFDGWRDLGGLGDFDGAVFGMDDDS